MKLIESLIQGKAENQNLCEDQVVFTSDFAAVIDGCSSSSEMRFLGMKPGRAASLAAKEVIEQLNPLATAGETAEKINNTIRTLYKKTDCLREVKQDASLRASCYFAIYSHARREVWVIGDCKALFAGTLVTEEKQIDTLAENLRSLVIRALVSQGATEKQLLEKQNEITGKLSLVSSLQPLFQNGDDPLFGYPCIDGFHTPGRGIQVAQIPDGCRELCLCSDGYPSLLPSLKESEAELERIIREDPLCYRQFLSVKGVIPRNHSFDDRSYLRINIEN